MMSAPALTIHRSLTKGLRLFDADRLRWLDEAAAIGPLVALRMGPVKLSVVTDAEVARTLLVTDASSWTRPPATLAPIRVGVGENLFTQSDNVRDFLLLMKLIGVFIRSSQKVLFAHSCKLPQT